MTESRRTGPLGTGALVAYALPSIALQAMMVPLLLTLPPLYAQELGIGMATISLALILARSLEAISDPLIGALSDRTAPGPWQRAGWMILGTPIAVLSGIALLHPSPGAGGLYLFVCLVLFYGGWTLVYIPYQSWGAELSDDFVERSRVAAFREAGSFLGYLLAALIPLIVLVIVMGQDAPTFGAQARAVGWFFTLALPVFVFLCIRYVPRAVRQQRVPHIPWSQMFHVLGRNKPFRLLLGAYMFDRLALGIHFAVLPFYMQYVLDMLAAYIPMGLVISIAPIVSIPAWLALSRRFGKHRVYCVANVLTAAGYASLAFLPAHVALWILLGTAAVRGFGNAGTMILPASMGADTVDYDEWRAGVRQAGAHMAFLAFVQKLGLAGGAIGLVVVSWFGFKEAGGEHTEAALAGVRFGAAWLPALMLIPTVVLMWNFPLDRRRHGILRRRLDGRANSVPLSPA